jgi:hypothetical protein
MYLFDIFVKVQRPNPEFPCSYQIYLLLQWKRLPSQLIPLSARAVTSFVVLNLKVSPPWQPMGLLKQVSPSSCGSQGTPHPLSKLISHGPCSLCSQVQPLVALNDCECM